MSGAGNTSGGPLYGGGIYIFHNANVILQYSHIHSFRATAGGGVYLNGGAAILDPSTYPQLMLEGGSSIYNNTAKNGAGILANYGTVIFQGGFVFGNTAQDNGGGIYLADDAYSSDLTSSTYHISLISRPGKGANTIRSNTAGSSGYSTSSGFGGGIYSDNAQIYFAPHHSGTPEIVSYILSNTANRGGGIYLKGPDEAGQSPNTIVYLLNSNISNNTAKAGGGGIYSLNAVYVNIGSYPGGHCLDSEGESPCSIVAHNTTYEDPWLTTVIGPVANGGAVYIYNDRSDGLAHGTLQVSGTLLKGNSDPDGLAAVAATGGTSEMQFTRDIFVDNSAANGPYLGIPSALIYSPNGKDIDFRYNTVLDSNTSTRMFNMNGGTLNVTGSILWGTIDHGHPFHFVWFHTGGAIMATSNCVLVRQHDNGTVDVPGYNWVGYPPTLDAGFAPRARSAAIDHCDAGSGNIAPPDAYGNTIHDDPGVAARWHNVAPYNIDLGAVEQTDVIFSSSFGKRDSVVGALPDYPPEN